MAVIKADCDDLSKKELKDLAKKKGETESALVRRAVRELIRAEAAHKPKSYWS